MLSLTPIFGKTRDHFETWPDSGLSAALVAAAIVIILIAIYGKLWQKALVAAYVFLP